MFPAFLSNRSMILHCAPAWVCKSRRRVVQAIYGCYFSQTVKGIKPVASGGEACFSLFEAVRAIRSLPTGQLAIPGVEKGTTTERTGRPARASHVSGKDNRTMSVYNVRTETFSGDWEMA